MSIQITPHFNAKEFLVSKHHPALASKMSLSEEEINKFYLLCQFGLEPIRKVFKPVIILSGKRSRELNSAIGGGVRSQHMFSEAVDFTVPDTDMHDIYTYIKHDLFWPGELIRYRNRGFIHLALPRFGVTSDVFERP